MAVEKPQKVELGNLIFEDIIFFSDSSLLLCREPQPTPYDVPAAAAFRKQVFKISESRCQILKGLKEQKKRGIDMSKQIAAVRSPNKKHPSLELFNQKDGARKSIMGLRQGSMILSPSSTPAKPNLFFPSRDFPAVKTLEKIPSKVISSPPSMQASNIFNDDFSKAAMAIFQEAQAKTSSKVKQQLQKIVASVDAHDLVFGELHPRGTTNGVMVTAPSDLMRVPGKDLAKSYMGLITNGQEENVINFTLSGGAFYSRHRRSKSDRNPHAALDENSEESQPRKPINVEVNSRNLNICYSILDRVDKGIEKVKGYKGDMLEKVNVIKQGLKECRKQAEKRILINIERKKAYEEAMNPETNALMPLGVTIAERIAKMAKESEEYEKRVQDVKASKEQQNNSKIERFKEIIHLMKPHMDLKEVQQLKQLTEHSKDVQKLLFIVKTAGFLRLVDALRKVYRIEKRFSMHDTKLRQLVLNVASRYTAPDHRYWFEGLVKKVRLDSTIKRITMQRLRKKVIQSSNTVIMKAKALKTFFSIAILKKYQSMLYLQLRYEAYMLKTFTHGTIPHQVIETHLIKAQFLLKECFQVNKDLIQKNRNLLAARLCLSTDHISNVMGAADHRIGIEDEASSVSYTAILEEAADGKKAGESKVAIRSSPEYTLSEEERSTKKGIKILKCCYLPYTKHCSLALPSQAIPVRPEQITEASSSKLLAKLANLFARVPRAEVEA